MSAGQFPDEQSDEGEFLRQEDAFRNWIRVDGSTPYTPEAGRYHLYVSLACPWAHRTIIVRQWKNLDEIIGMTVVDPIRDERGWRFGDGPGVEQDPLNGWAFLSEAYKATNPDYRGRVTVPVLWDQKTGRIVSNNEDDVMEMFDSAFDELLESPFQPGTLYPPALRPEIDRLSAVIYDTLNDGVYKCGFATSQGVYEKHVYTLFDTLDMLESRLSRRRYLTGSEITAVDWKLFVTLIRFDAVYHGHFKCNLRRIVDYPNLFAYLRDLYQQPGIEETVNFDHIKRHYYITHESLNPTGIVPAGPDQDLMEPHERDVLSPDWEVAL